MKVDDDFLGACIDAIYRDLDGVEACEEYHKRHMTPSLQILTNFHPESVEEVMRVVRPHIKGKTVVEIGAGVGLLAISMARTAKQVFAIESDPGWSWAFTKELYKRKPPNLTFIFGAAESLVGLIKADVAVIVTHSGHAEMQRAAGLLATQVIDVWADRDRRIIAPDARSA